MLFLASEASIDIRSFCYKELRAARGQILTVTLKALAADDDRLAQALPDRAKARQIEPLDQQPVEGFDYVSPKDNTRGSIALNLRQVESIGVTLRDLGVAPDSFAWTSKPEGPFPGLPPLQEGDEAIFCGRALDIRDGLKALDELRGSVTQKALIIQAPSGAGKSSFLRAGLWTRLRRSAAFTPLAIIRTDKGAIRNPTWGLVAGLYDTLLMVPTLRKHLPLTRADLAARARTDLAGLLAQFAEADRTEGTTRRTLLLAIDQAEELATLAPHDAAETERLIGVLLALPNTLDVRLVLTARDDSLDATRQRLADFGLPHEAVATWRLHRLPYTRLNDVIAGPAAAALQAGFPLDLPPQLVDALAQAAGDGGDALPILAVALRRLVADHREPDGKVTLPPAEAKAFLDSAVADAVSEALADAEANMDDLRRLIIPQLATWDPQANGEGAAKRLVVYADQLFRDGRAGLKPLADELVRQRLLSVGATDSGAAYEVAHEALLRVEPLGGLIHALREQFELARIVLREARDWKNKSQQTKSLLEDGWTSEFTAYQSAAKREQAESDYLLRRGQNLHNVIDLIQSDDFRDYLIEARDYVLACVKADSDAIQREVKEAAQETIEVARLRITGGKPNVFISYSRVDSVFMELLREGLIERGYDVSVDKIDIVPGEDWRKRLDGIILKAQAVIFVISPDSVARWDALPPEEAVCAWEIRRTVELEKRLVAVDFRRAPGMTIPTELRLPHHVDATRPGAGYGLVGEAYRGFRSARDSGGPIADQEIAQSKYFEAATAYGNRWRTDPSFLASLADLDRALNVDTVLWERQLAPWLVRAEGWKQAKPIDQPGKLLSIGDLAEINAWAGRRPAAAPAMPLTIQTFIRESLDNIRREGKSRRRIIGRAFVQPAMEANARGEHEHALRIAAAGALLAEDLDMTLVPELWPAAAQAIMRIRTKCLLAGHTASIVAAKFSPDGIRVVTGSDDRTARLWDAEGGAGIAVLRGHQGPVVAVSFSPDGKRVLTGSHDKSARLWEAENGKEIAVLTGHQEPVLAASFSPDGSLVVTASRDHTARIWDARSGGQIAVLNSHESTVWAASFSFDGSRLVTGSEDKTARIWDVESGTLIAVLKGHMLGIRAASFSPDGKYVLTGSTDKSASIWDAASGVELAVLKDHEGEVAAASFSPDGKRVVTGSYDDTARLWDAASGAEIAILRGHTKWPLTVSFSPDGKRVVTGAHDNTARLWDAETGIEIFTMKAHDAPVRSASFSPDGKSVLTCSDDNTARIWDAARGNEIAVLIAHKNPVLAASYCPSGTRVLTGSDDSSARIWNAESGAELVALKGHKSGVRAANFDPGGTRVVTGSYDNTARLWDAASGAEITVLVSQSDWVHAASFSPDGRQVLTGSSDDTARLWNVEASAEIAVFRGHTRPVNTATFSPDGKSVVTGSDDTTARLWKTEGGAETTILKGHQGEVRAASFSPDGTLVATGSRDHTARLWEVKTGAEVAVLIGHSNWVHAASFSPDGKLVVTGSFDHTARLWDAASGAEIAILTHTNSVHAASFSPDGRRLVTGSEDKTARIFDVSRSAAFTRGRALVLTAALARGIGVRTPPEAVHVLMKEAPPDLFTAALYQLGLPLDDPALHEVISALHAPLHDNCYLSLSQFGAMAADEEHAVSDDVQIFALPASKAAREFEPMVIAESDLAGETFIETRNGVHIFLLADGRYHVVDHFAVASLDQAHSAADALAAAGWKS